MKIDDKSKSKGDSRESDQRGRKNKKKRKRAKEAAERAKEAAERAGCADADELKLRVAQAIEAGDCTKQLLPNAKYDCKKCVAERKQKKDALNIQKAEQKAVKGSGGQCR